MSDALIGKGLIGPTFDYHFIYTGMSTLQSKETSAASTEQPGFTEDLSVIQAIQTFHSKLVSDLPRRDEPLTSRLTTANHYTDQIRIDK